MASLGKTIIVVAACLLLAGCTFHFKAKDVELDSERQRVEKNLTYELEKVVFLDGQAISP